MDITTMNLMLTVGANLVQNVIHPAISLPEPTALLLMGTLMLTVGNLQRRATLLAKGAIRRSSNL